MVFCRERFFIYNLPGCLFTFVVVIICLLLAETGLHVVLIGLGGGGLSMFLRNNIPKVLFTSFLSPPTRLCLYLSVSHSTGWVKKLQMNFDEISFMIWVHGIANADTILVMILILMRIQEFCKGIFYPFWIGTIVQLLLVTQKVFDELWRNTLRME